MVILITFLNPSKEQSQERKVRDHVQFQSKRHSRELGDDQRFAGKTRMKSIVDSVFGRLEMLHDIAAINMHWWAGLIVFPHTRTDVTIELHGTPIGPTEIQQHSFAKLLAKYPTLMKSATDYDFESLELHNWELEKIVIFANGHIDLRLGFEGKEYNIHADENVSFLTPTEAEFY